jgi:sigma-B regulation protein RsbQ
VLQCSEDVIAPEAAVQFVDRELPDSRLVVLDAVGHCPNLSAPAETLEAIDAYLRG